MKSKHHRRRICLARFRSFELFNFLNSSRQFHKDALQQLLGERKNTYVDPQIKSDFNSDSSVPQQSIHATHQRCTFYCLCVFQVAFLNFRLLKSQRHSTFGSRMRIILNELKISTRRLGVQCFKLALENISN